MEANSLNMVSSEIAGIKKSPPAKSRAAASSPTLSEVTNYLSAPVGAKTIGDTRNILRNPLLNTLNEENVTPAMISRVVEDANKALEPTFFRLSFSIHDATERVLVKVIDVASEEVLREIPPETKLNTMAKILEVAGLIFDQRG